ncbi:methyltransferase [Mucilaginibacter sp.]|uniref:tRNA1(Val) (adenine(37)-N6)-methyltransferase n=1 Tax=Mucilaginibacter sp. TaxID=1882438 RepID=UPI0025E0FCE1|nr:methyltransferase [Mucilaginibacter sp.]
MFHFKQFSVDQSGCAMKINTDGVLLGALTGADNPVSILDIGTGTGVIALMLAQRFGSAQIDAVEIDESAAKTAQSNFKNSPFASRLRLYPLGFEAFFKTRTDRKYDLIISNPPFYINSLQSPGAKINLAKHAGDGFFEGLIEAVANNLNNDGICWLILPPDTALMVKDLALQRGLYLHKIINVHSFNDEAAHREILAFGFEHKQAIAQAFVIYDEPKIYSKAYQEVLKEFLTIF